jgi:hypothetical protein
MPKDRFGNDRDWAIGENADGTIDSVPLSEWPKRAAEIAAFEKMIDQLIALMLQGALSPEQRRRPISDLRDASNLLDEVLGQKKENPT